ncbi:MAG: FG-GAP-like repeat-containing protein [Candidatus Lutibacillus vidarii]
MRGSTTERAPRWAVGAAAMMLVAILLGTPVVTAQPAAATTGATLDAAIQKALGARTGEVGIALVDLRNGTTYLHNPDSQIYTASIVKVLILAAAIRVQRERGTWLTSTQQSLARSMITVSDNDAASTLYSFIGGSPTLIRVARLLGMTTTKAGTTWGRTTTTPYDQTVLLRDLVVGTSVLQSSDRSYILGLMGQVASSQDWGVGEVPSGATAQVKNGWAPFDGPLWRVNSIGRVVGPGSQHYVLAMMSINNTTYDAGVTRLNSLSSIINSALASVLTAGSDTSAPRDLSGDRRGDLVGWLPSGDLLGYASTSTGTLGSLGTIGRVSHATYPIAATAGDVDGNGLTDLVLLSPAGNAFLLPRASPSTWGTRRSLGSGWAANLVLGTGDFTGDHRADLITRRTDGTLWLYLGDGSGGVASSRRIGTGWSGMTAILCPGDFSGDGYPDLLARTATGDLLLYAGTPYGSLAAGVRVGTGWSGMRWVVSPGDVSGDGYSDVFAVTAAGVAWVYPGTGHSGFRAPVQVGTGWTVFAEVLR